jgi:KDO2-lipid IV(A) lauroyltransferase
LLSSLIGILRRYPMRYPTRVNLQHWVEYGALVATATLLRALPRRLALLTGSAIGWLGWTLRVRRSVVLANVAQALPEMSRRDRLRLAARAARNFGRTVTEFLRFSGRDRRQLVERITIRGLSELEAALAEGRGAIVVTGHLGAWALYVALLGLKGVPTALLVGRQRNPRVDALILSIPGEHVTFVSHGRRAPRELLQNLSAGKAMVMVADQHGGPRGTVAPFFGRPTSTLSLPAALVIRQDLPLFTMVGHRIGGGRHEVSFSRLDVPPDDGRGEEARRLQITTLCNQAIADAVLEHPDQYFWYHRRFRTPGDGREPLHSESPGPA